MFGSVCGVWEFGSLRVGPGFGGWFHIRVCVVLFAGKIARRGAGVQGKVWGHLVPEGGV